jgi:predicted transcriptional regulator
LITLENLVEQLELTPVAAETSAGTREVTGVYCSDLLSDVMSRARAGNLLITSLTHHNVIAVAVLVGLSAIIITGGRPPKEATVEAAGREGIPLYTTKKNKFEMAGLVYRLLYN